MSITISVQEADGGGQALLIKLAGRLDISSYGEFNEYKSHLEGSSKVVLDMAELEYLDSSALGMLLMLRERAGGVKSKIDIINCSPAVLKILSAVKFDVMFNVKQSS